MPGDDDAPARPSTGPALVHRPVTTDDPKAIRHQQQVIWHLPSADDPLARVEPPAFLSVQQLVAVLECPVSERLHRAVDQALSQRGQRVLDPRRGLRESTAVHQAVATQPV